MGNVWKNKTQNKSPFIGSSRVGTFTLKYWVLSNTQDQRIPYLWPNICPFPHKRVNLSSFSLQKYNRLGSCLQLCPSSVVAEHCYTVCFMFYWLKINNQTDQGDKTEGLETEGLKGDIGDGCEGIILCLSLIWETFRFTVPPAVELLTYWTTLLYKKSCTWTFADFSQTRSFRGVFSVHVYHNIAGRISEGAMGGEGGAKYPVLPVHEPKKTGALSSRVHMRNHDQNPLVANIYLIFCNSCEYAMPLINGGGRSKTT